MQQADFAAAALLCNLQVPDLLPARHLVETDEGDMAARMNAVPPDPKEVRVEHGVARNLAEIRARIARAAARAGRAADDITLVAVSKTHPADAVRDALAAGQLVFGENRVQEAAGKFPPLRERWPGLRVHLIGALQTNKARDAVRIADVVEVLDRPRLADAIADAAQREGKLPELLIQVNVGDEPQKAGVSRAEADALIDTYQARFGAALTGLMCIPPAASDPAPHFAWLASCAVRHGLPLLSMGMSADFEIAIEHGATHVRVGSAIFGQRPAQVRPP